MALQTDAEAAVESSIDVGRVEAPDQVDALHRRLPVAVLGAVDGGFSQSFGLDAPFLSVGLGPAGELRPSGAIGLDPWDGAEQVDEVAGCGTGGGCAERNPTGGDLDGEVVAVGEGVGVGLEPVVTVVLGGLEFVVAFVEPEELAAVGAPGPGEAARAGGTAA
ncbi:MAG: hypothetical protein H0T99_12410 [Geodermatophilaceae bacterium]|nr:hypothetical protein [Geodermatophilaceae bacterium]